MTTTYASTTAAPVVVRVLPFASGLEILVVDSRDGSAFVLIFSDVDKSMFFDVVFRRQQF